MREMILFLAILLLILTSLGCDGEPEESGIVNITVTNPGLNYCSPASDPCSKSFDVSFEDTKDIGEDLYYWPEFDTPYGTYKGKWVKRFNAGDTLSMKATALYPGFSYGDSCELLISSSFTAEDAVRKNATRRHGQYQGLVYIPDFDPDCFRYCCSDSSVSDGWYWVSGKRYGTDIIGVKAQIKSRYGKLCGEDCSSTRPAHQAVYVDISKELADDTLWIQTGYIKLRLSGYTEPSFGWYTEVNVDGYHQGIDSVNPIPLEGSWHSYGCEVDKSTGNLEFWCDSVWVRYEGYGTSWSGSAGNSVQVSAEIYGRESDMAGTVQHPCSTNVCKYWEYGSNYTFFNFFDPDVEVGTTDSGEWWIEAWAQDGLRFWDKNPLP